VHRIKELICVPPPLLQPNLLIIYITWTLYPGVTYEVETSTDLRRWRKAPGAIYSAGVQDCRQTLLYELQTELSMSFFRVVAKDNPFD
jgi:hypothetical protein